MPSSERDNMRQVFFDAWFKYQNSHLLEPLEAHIVNVIIRHPEYHNILTQETSEHENPNEQNPFLHMGLHLALQEQIATNRPNGIKSVYEKLCLSLKDNHAVEHKMMDCLAEILWDAQRFGKTPNEEVYIEMLKQL